MKIAYTVEPLDSPNDWSRLAQALGGENRDVVRHTLRHLRVLDAKCYVLEDSYIDRDYSADFFHFYARTFRAHARHCKRVHFFSADISPMLRRPLSTDGLRQMQNFASTTYCGFCVIRPLPTAPIGRTVLKGRVRSGFTRRLPSRAAHTSTRICSASTCKSLVRPSSNRTPVSARAPKSPSGQACDTCTRGTTTTGFPWRTSLDSLRPRPQPRPFLFLPGADFLTSERMIRGINEAGYQPLCFRRPDIARSILQYVESGIPVILGLNVGETVGHAVTVIGRVFAKQDSPTNRAIDYVPAYLVHDDQGGPYMRLPMDADASTTFSFSDDTIKRDTPDGTIELNVRDHAVFAVALMSTRVFSTAAAAEHSARDRIDDTLQNMPRTRQLLDKLQLPVNTRLLDELQAAHRADRIVLRTYLTSAAGYRRHLVGGSASDNLKDAVLDLPLPHFTWITEISTIDSYNNSSPGLRRIYGHTVLDATSTGKAGDGLLVLHLPGLLFTNDINAREDPEQFAIIDGDTLYECREKRL